MNRNYILELNDITKTYKQGGSVVKVLNNVNLKVSAKESIAIVGASGSGKSTLLHIAGFLDKADSGKVLYNGIDNIKCDHKLRLAKVGFIYQYHHLLTDFNARENVALPLLLAGEKPFNALIRADKMLSKLGLNLKLYNLPGELSGGEQQRVAIARSLINNPEIILADEPTGNLDPATAKDVFEIFLKLVKEYNTAIVAVTHNHDLASLMNKTFELNQGTLNLVKNN